MLSLAWFNVVTLGVAMAIGLVTARWAFRPRPPADKPNEDKPAS